MTASSIQSAPRFRAWRTALWAGVAVATTAAGQPGPYGVDAHTRHLWRFDAAGPVADAVPGGIALTLDSSTTTGGAAFSPAFGDALDNRDPAPTGGAYGPEDTSMISFQDHTTGAFTYEALVYLDFDPSTDTRLMQILSMDNEGDFVDRAFQWRMEWSSETMVFINIDGGADGVQRVSARLPGSGAHQPNQGAWYHTAVTYDGIADAVGNLSFFWTRLDSSATNANQIAITSGSPHDRLRSDLVATVGDPAIGNEARNPATLPWDGYLDEVRVSSLARRPWDFVFFHDADSDGLRDGWEIQWFGSTTNQIGAGHADGDGFDNADEQAAGSDPTNPDSTPDDADADTLPDAWEQARLGTIHYGPGDDPDGDGLDNAGELAAGTDPGDPSSNPYDTDNDGMADADEITYFGDLQQGPYDDFDHDGFGNLVELHAGTHPADALHMPAGAAVAFIPVTDHDPATDEQGWAGANLNSAAFVQNNLITVSNQQFIAYYRRHATSASDPDNNTVLVARRTAGETQWDIFATDLVSNNDYDGHNIISFAIDGDGVLHMSWGMHGGDGPFNYARSTGPVPGTNDVVMVRQAMSGEENSVTYPHFQALPNGDVVYFFREGGSGSGDWYLSYYSIATDLWRPLHTNASGAQVPFIQGRGDAPDNCFYPDRLTLDAFGRLHVAGCFRYNSDSPAGESGYQTNHRYAYMRSSDYGVTWGRSDGSTIDLPIVEAPWFLGLGASHVPEIVEDIPEGSSLINEQGMTTDRAGNPIIATWFAANALTGDHTRQYHVYFHDGTHWHRRTVSARTVDSPTTKYSESQLGSSRMGRPIVITDEDDRIIVVYSDNQDTKNVTVVFTEPLAQDPARMNWTRLDLTTEDLGGWEPTYDEERWKQDGVLHMLYQPLPGAGISYASQNHSTPVSVLQWDANAYFHVGPTLLIDVGSAAASVTLSTRTSLGLRYELRSTTDLGDGFASPPSVSVAGVGDVAPLGTWPMIATQQFWRVEARDDATGEL